MDGGVGAFPHTQLALPERTGVSGLGSAVGGERVAGAMPAHLSWLTEERK